MLLIELDSPLIRLGILERLDGNYQAHRKRERERGREQQDKEDLDQTVNTE